jgi:hypothetical protein
VVWSLEHSNVLLIIFTSPWRWEEFLFSVELSRQQLRTHPDTVYVVVDRRFAGTAPPDTGDNLINHFKIAMTDLPTNIAMIVLVGRATSLSTLFATLVQENALPMPVRFLATMEEAFEVIMAEEGRRKRGTGPLKIS